MRELLGSLNNADSFLLAGPKLPFICKIVLVDSAYSRKLGQLPKCNLAPIFFLDTEEKKMLWCPTGSTFPSAITAAAAPSSFPELLSEDPRVRLAPTTTNLQSLDLAGQPDLVNCQLWRVMHCFSRELSSFVLYFCVNDLTQKVFSLPILFSSNTCNLPLQLGAERFPTNIWLPWKTCLESF